MDEKHPLGVGVVLFDEFEVLDVFGPIELLGVLPEHFEIRLVGPEPGPVRSAQGPRVVADLAYEGASTPDVVLVPGGRGTRRLVDDRRFCEWLAEWASPAQCITSVCTGSALLASAGLLEGHRATSNKRAFRWAQQQGSAVSWVPEARWVEDGNRWTSSGVAAGMDMTLALIAHLCGGEVAEAVADGVELEWHRDPGWDPYAAKNDLVPRQ